MNQDAPLEKFTGKWKDKPAACIRCADSVDESLDFLHRFFIGVVHLDSGLRKDAWTVIHRRVLDSHRLLHLSEYVLQNQRSDPSCDFLHHLILALPCNREHFS